MNKMFLAILTAISLLSTVPAWADSVEPETTTAVILHVDINTDSAEKMADLLNGVGMKKANAIVSYRQQYGQFKTVDDLLNVSGIGPATLEKNRSAIVIGTAQ